MVWNEGTEGELTKRDIFTTILFYSIRESKDEALVLKVQNYHWLYDRKARRFKDSGMKNNSWAEIARSLDTEGKLQTIVTVVILVSLH